MLAGTAFRPSENDYDWLGRGIYFWEANPRRGIEFYKEARTRKGLSTDDAMVVGAIIDLGHCLDLCTSTGVEAIKEAYGLVKSAFDQIEMPMPENTVGPDLLVRKLDCLVINALHESRADNQLPPFDSVRGIFQEGDALYPTSGFRERTHVQIAVCEPAQIKGVFRVPDSHL